MKRKIIKIDEEKCTGCGLCADACAEGAIQIIDGKAKLVSEVYCDGLGACIGECPYGAITIEEREAAPFSHEEVQKNLAKKNLDKQREPKHFSAGCPGMKSFSLKREKVQSSENTASEIPSELSQWPIQLHLVPVVAPYWENCDLLIAADCTAFSFGDFHRKFLSDKRLVIACPKLDDAGNYSEKLASIISENQVRSVTVLRMEVPCCGGIANFAREAIAMAGKDIPLKVVIIGIDGSIKSIEEE